MMILVAVIALAQVIITPIAKGIIYQYRMPFSSRLVWVDLTPRRLGSSKLISLGQTVATQCQYDIRFSKQLPSGLHYRVTVEVQMIESKTGIIEDIYRKKIYVRSGEKSVRGEVAHDLKPFRRGHYRVRFESHVNDLFGRQSLPYIKSEYFEAR
jgi:hypothetical protein